MVILNPFEMEEQANTISPFFFINEMLMLFQLLWSTSGALKIIAHLMWKFLYSFF